MYAAEPYIACRPSTTNSKHISFAISEDEKYVVAKHARERLLIESSFKDHNLRRLVGHANLVDKFLAEYQPPEPQKYAVTHVERMEKKTSGENARVSAYIMQPESRDGGEWLNENSGSFAIQASKQEIYEATAQTASGSAQGTIDYDAVQIVETEVFNDDSD